MLPYQWTYVGVAVSSDGFDIHGYPISLDVIRNLFMDIGVFMAADGLYFYTYP